MPITSKFDDYGYSRDQFYRRIKLLTDAGLISPQRGRHNEIMLSPKEEHILREFRAIEQNSPKLSLELCLERLQARLLREELENVRLQLDYLRAENKNLRTALVRYRRWSFRRIIERLKSVFRRARTTRTP